MSLDYKQAFNLRKIHDFSMRILEEIGIRLHDPDILKLLKSRGVAVEGSVARFKEDKLMEWVGKAPQSFTIHGRNPRHNMYIGGGNTEYVPGYGCPTVVRADGTRRSATLEDYVTFLKLVHQSPYFRMNGGILVQPCDIPIEVADLLMIFAAVVHSDKCVLGIPGHKRNIQGVMDLMSIVFGGGKKVLMKRPRILTMISTLSPLQIDAMALESMMICARNNQPMIISPAPAAGTTGPVTFAGNLALANAEALAGIAISQMIKRGTPVIYGLQCYDADLRTGSISIGSPGYSLQAAYTAQLARMYGLPSRTGGANTDAKALSLQSGYETMMSMLTACQNRVNLIVHAAGPLDSYSAMSFEKFIADIEIIRMIDYYLWDIDFKDENFAFDVIKEAGPGGNFMGAEHTARTFRSVSWMPEVGLRGHMLEGEFDSRLLSNIRSRMDLMLGDYRRPELDPAVLAGLVDYLADAGVDSNLIDPILDR